MPIPAANLYPPFNIVRLSHVELGVSDLAWSRAYYVDMLGLQVSHEDAGHIYLRALEERGHHCMILKKAEAGHVGVLGFKVGHAGADERAGQQQGFDDRFHGKPFGSTWQADIAAG